WTGLVAMSRARPQWKSLNVAIANQRTTTSMVLRVRYAVVLCSPTGLHHSVLARHADALLGQASAHVLIFQLPAAEPAIAHPILESRITQTTGSSKALACALALRQRAKLVRLTTSRQSRDIRATPFQIRLKVLRCPAQQHGADRLLLGLGTNVMEARDGATLVAAGAAGSVQPTYERLGGPD